MFFAETQNKLLFGKRWTSCKKPDGYNHEILAWKRK
jgi:hypothetical protein